MKSPSSPSYIRLAIFTLSASMMVAVMNVSAVAQESETRDEEPGVEQCQVVDSVTTDERSIWACEDGRVVIDDQNRQEIRMAPGRVQTLIEADGEVWVATTRQTAALVDTLPDAVAAGGAGRGGDSGVPDRPSESAASTAMRGSVLSSELGVVIVDLGSEDELQIGDRVEFVVEQTTALGEGQEAEQERIVAVAPVQTVTDDRAGVALGISERVPDDAFVRPSERNITESLHTPPRLGSLTRTSVQLRPFLALSTLGAGTVSQGLVAHQFEGPWTIEAIFDPLAFGIAEEANLLAVTATGLASFDTTLFQVGLGLGATTVDATAFGPRDEFDESGDDPEVETELALALAQKVRLGALDGLHLQVSNSFFLADEAFRYGGTTAQIQIPAGSIGESSWLIARGGGSFAGHSFGEVGLRVLSRGNGDRGSVYFTPTVGGANIRGAAEVERQIQPNPPTTIIEQVSYGGPMIGFEVEWRP